MGVDGKDEFDDLKLVLGRYARSRAGRPWARVDAEFGEIMLRLLKFADQLDVDLIDSGTIDSLFMMGVINFIEREYRLVFGMNDLIPRNFKSVNALARYVEERTK